MKGEDDGDDVETSTEIDRVEESSVNFLLANRLQLMVSHLDDLTQAQQNLLAMIQKLQQTTGQQEDKREPILLS